MEKRLLKVVIVTIITVVLSGSVYGQGAKKDETGQMDAIHLHTLTTQESKISPNVMQVKSLVSQKYKVTDFEKSSVFDPETDYILFMDGKVFVKSKGKFFPVKPEGILGTMKVNAKGKVIKKDGTVVVLKEGDAMTEEGVIVKADEMKVLSERMKIMDAMYAEFLRREWEMQETMLVFDQKIQLMNTKMDLVNQKMILMLDQMNTPKMTRRQIKEYIENISLLDAAIENTEYKIKEIEGLQRNNSN